MKQIRLAMLALCGALFLLGFTSGARSAQAAEDVKGEIAYLIGFVRHSPCTFIRNGTEYAGPAAADHVQSKYDYYKDQIKTVQDFIDRAATKSMLSGEPYQVRCPGGPTIKAADWLRTEFAAYQVKQGESGASSN
jgi:hypothetical protein